MAEVRVFKTNEKVVLWLHRENQTRVWLAGKLGVNKTAVSNKITDNVFTVKDIAILKMLGCTL